MGGASLQRAPPLIRGRRRRRIHHSRALHRVFRARGLFCILWSMNTYISRSSGRSRCIVDLFGNEKMASLLNTYDPCPVISLRVDLCATVTPRLNHHGSHVVRVHIHCNFYRTAILVAEPTSTHAGLGRSMGKSLSSLPAHPHIGSDACIRLLTLAFKVHEQ